MDASDEIAAGIGWRTVPRRAEAWRHEKPLAKLPEPSRQTDTGDEIAGATG
jgi:hypothetical protein